MAPQVPAHFSALGAGFRCARHRVIGGAMRVPELGATPDTDAELIVIAGWGVSGRRPRFASERAVALHIPAVIDLGCASSVLTAGIVWGPGTDEPLTPMSCCGPGDDAAREPSGRSPFACAARVGPLPIPGDHVMRRYRGPHNQ